MALTREREKRSLRDLAFSEEHREARCQQKESEGTATRTMVKAQILLLFLVAIAVSSAVDNGFDRTNRKEVSFLVLGRWVHMLGVDFSGST